MHSYKLQLQSVTSDVLLVSSLPGDVEEKNGISLMCSYDCNRYMYVAKHTYCRLNGLNTVAPVEEYSYFFTGHSPAS